MSNDKKKLYSLHYTAIATELKFSTFSPFDIVDFDIFVRNHVGRTRKSEQKGEFNKKQQQQRQNVWLLMCMMILVPELFVFCCCCCLPKTERIRISDLIVVICFGCCIREWMSDVNALKERTDETEEGRGRGWCMWTMNTWKETLSNSCAPVFQPNKSPHFPLRLHSSSSSCPFSSGFLSSSVYSLCLIRPLHLFLSGNENWRNAEKVART